MSDMPLQIDWDFISDREGGQKLKGYVPPFPHSGVTIASGVDIGQRDKAEIQNLPISSSLKNKLLPYAGLKGEAAVEALKEKPLSITSDEARLLDLIVQSKIIQQMVRIFEAQSELEFDQMPIQFETVMASLAWNIGPHFGSETPFALIWHNALSGCFAAMATQLENCPILPERRKLEAQLLRTIPK